MTDWNGRGLPPEAKRRIERITASRVRGSLLSSAQTLSIGAVGFRPVSEVIGLCVMQTVWPAYVSCNTSYGFGSPWSYAPNAQYPAGSFGGPDLYRTTRADTINGAGTFLRAIRDNYRLALNRLRDEAQAIGAHGVIDMRLTRSQVGPSLWEVSALGTAVRADSAIELDRPFITELSGHDVARMMLSGWVPVTTEVAVDVGIRHGDWNSRRQAYGGRWNGYFGEVDAWTDVVQKTRVFTRETLHRGVAASGADGVVVTGMDLRTFTIEPAEGHFDMLAESRITGTTVTRFARSTAPPPEPLTFLPLTNRTTSTRGR